MVAAWLRWVDLADEVWLVPTASHAFGKVLAPFGMRVALCEALAETVGGWVRVSDVEASMPAPNYTLHTLNRLVRQHPDVAFRLVVGADQVPVLPRWHRWREIEARFAPIVVGRAGYESPPGMPVFPGISSTDVRARIADGASIEHLVPASVCRLIESAVIGGPVWR